MPARPSVDLGLRFGILAPADTRPDGCYSIGITGAQPSIEGQSVFDVVETQPGPNCVCTQAVTQPAHAVLITRCSGYSEYLERAGGRADVLRRS